MEASGSDEIPRGIVVRATARSRQSSGRRAGARAVAGTPSAELRKTTTQRADVWGWRPQSLRGKRGEEPVLVFLCGECFIFMTIVLTEVEWAPRQRSVQV